MPRINHVLCPVDFSDTSDHAIEHATAIAAWYGSRITALHVVTPVTVPAFTALTPSYPAQIRLGDAERRQLEDAIAQRFRTAGTPGLPVTTAIDEGLPVPLILEHALRDEADLIVMGTHGASGFQHLLLGSVTEKVLRKAPCPVLTVPPRAQATSRLPYKHILCAVDFSESSLVGLEHALSLARESDAALTLVHVIEWPWEEPPAPPFDELPPAQAMQLIEFRKHREEESRKHLEALVPAGAREWCTPSVHVVHGKPWVEVLRAASAAPTDLIVVGIHGRRALDLTVFGSTTNQVVRRAMCPVLTIRR
jgi:nucleotide-binding universal stress UspA family protein